MKADSDAALAQRVDQRDMLGAAQSELRSTQANLQALTRELAGKVCSRERAYVHKVMNLA